MFTVFKVGVFVLFLFFIVKFYDNGGFFYFVYDVSYGNRFLYIIIFDFDSIMR